MLDELRARLGAVAVRLRRIERREIGEFRRWIETTSNLLHLTVLVAVPLLIGLVTLLSNVFSPVFFLVYPPLASATYTLFSDPRSEYASPLKFVGGTTLGALSGLVALEVAILVEGGIPPGPFQVSASSAALAIFLTVLVTWALDVEEPSAFSMALLILLVGGGSIQRLAYVVGVIASSALIAGVFVVWRDRFYEERARYLYRSTEGDDHVLVAMRGDPTACADAAQFAGGLSAVHDAGMVVLLGVVDDAAIEDAERTLLSELSGRLAPAGPPDSGESQPDGIAAADAGDPADLSVEDVLTCSGVPGGVDATAIAGVLGIAEGTAPDPDALAELVDEDHLASVAEERAVTERAARLEELAATVETDRGTSCQVVVAVADDGGWSSTVVASTVDDTGCDLVVAPYDPDDPGQVSFVDELFGMNEDVIAFRSDGETHGWTSALVPVRSPSDVANAMVEFARRITGPDGRISVCHCIASERQRRAAESMLATLVEAFPGEYETRVANADIEEFLEDVAPAYDLVLLGASTDRTTASRFLSPPTFERVGEVDADVAVVHRGQ